MASAAIENATMPVISTISIAFCSVFDCVVPARFSTVSATTPSAAQIAELWLPKAKISEA